MRSVALEPSSTPHGVRVASLLEGAWFCRFPFVDLPVRLPERYRSGSFLCSFRAGPFARYLHMHPHTIRTGILCIPSFDEEALQSARRTLHENAPHVVVVAEHSVAMQRNWIAETLRRWSDEDELDLILTVGGTLPAPGLSASEIVPEATLEVLERLLPGLPETMRAEAVADSPLALLDRGVAGIRGRTLIVNLPESLASVVFLRAICDVLPAIVAHLQGRDDAPRLDQLSEPATDAPIDDANPAGTRKGLDPDEFAAWLAR